jgi:hypothetical protein
MALDFFPFKHTFSIKFPDTIQDNPSEGEKEAVMQMVINAFKAKEMPISRKEYSGYYKEDIGDRHFFRDAPEGRFDIDFSGRRINFFFYTKLVTIIFSLISLLFFVMAISAARSGDGGGFMMSLMFLSLGGIALAVFNYRMSNFTKGILKNLEKSIK